MVGSSISHYEILDKLGQGGMGVVYRAEDTKLDRPVALKFLPSHLLGDEDVRKRFEREAKAAAALNHPNICAVYEIDEADGKSFIAMAFLEGESLEKKIAQGPLKLEEALSIARQIAEGLEAAHEKGIHHRDIKPENVIVNAKGRVTIMDFGLAQLTEASRLTRTDETLGTTAYMSPEQTQGSGTDHRTDIWALGVVLYEMVVREKPFKGDYDKAVMYSILNEAHEPITGLRAGVPMDFEFIVGKCLEKAADQRYDSASDIAKDLRSLSEKLKSGRSAIVKSAVVGASAAEPSAEATAAPADLVPRNKLHLALAMAAALAGVLAAVSVLYFTQAPVERTVRRWSFSPPPLASSGNPVEISPNGRHIAYVADSGGDVALWVRDLDREEPRELAGTEGASRPFWSPDSRLIGFAAGGEVKKISVQGGPAITLGPQLGSRFSGGSWSPDGESIAFSSSVDRSGARVFEVPAQGGEPRLLVEPQETGGANPHFLPAEAGARSLLLRGGARQDPDVVLKNLDTGESSILAKGSGAIYSPSGHILYQWHGALWALPFSLDRLKATGEAFPIIETSRSATVARDGTLVSVGALSSTDLQQLVWRDRTGEKVGEIGQPQAGIGYPVLSPDGRRVAVRSDESGNLDVWVHEVERPLKRRLTFDDAPESRPQWSPSGREVTFQSERGGIANIFRRAADGTGEAELLIGTETDKRPWGWSRDGDYLVYSVAGAGFGDLWYLKRNGDGEGFESLPFLATPFREEMPNLSPDGNFLAYCSNQSGEDEVYVQSFPSGDGLSQISTNGGCQPRWSRDGKELFYVDGVTLMAVEVTTSPVFAAGVIGPLFSDLYLRDPGPTRATTNYDVSADGRFVMVGSAESEGADGEQPPIQVIENWYEEFRDRE